MKRTLFAFLFTTACSISATAQHQFNLGYGYGTQQMIRHGFGAIPYKVERETSPDRLSLYITESVFEINDKEAVLNDPKRTGAIFATYRYGIFRWLSAGLTIGYEGERREVNIGGLQPIGMLSRTATTIAAECELTYGHVGLVSFYGNMGFGNTLATEKITSNSSAAQYKTRENYFALQLTPFGVSVGKKLKGFSQLGYGYKGILQVGALMEF